MGREKEIRGNKWKTDSSNNGIKKENMEREKEQAKGWSANITSQQYANHFEFFQFRIPLAAAEEQETEN